jgi:hypothetical protein
MTWSSNVHERFHGVADRRAFVFGLAASLAVHIALLSMPIVRGSAARSVARQPPTVARNGAVRLVNLRIANTGRVLSVTAAVIERVRSSPAAPRETGPTADRTLSSGSADAAVPSTDVHILRRRPVVSVPAGAPRATAAAAARIANELKPFNDSIVEVESRGRPTDWSIASSSGGRWGISPGAVHLGSRTLSPCKLLLDPFTCKFRVSDAARQELRARVEMHREIQLQAARSEGDRQLRSRIRTMENRAAAARDTTRVP